jgi:hypothetical protein
MSIICGNPICRDDDSDDFIASGSGGKTLPGLSHRRRPYADAHQPARHRRRDEEQYDEEISLLRDADVTQVAIDLARYQVLYEMSLNVAAKMFDLTLLDYLR